ncbi:pilus assembly protein TadG-related protein [Sphingomonas sp.]|uniref:TadE/TadG family type IV pilus assembly protein n=1 Tax=Sphingomonas sp. TaxID=28214 RepID=UPI0031D9A7D4
MTFAPLTALRDLLRHRRGNVMMLFALALPVMTFSIGMGVDYARAMKAQTKLNAIADAAALLAVSKTMMKQSDSTAISYARSMFQTQSAALTDIGDVTLSSLTVSAPTNSNGQRSASVSYVARSNNVFAAILGVDTLTISGKSATMNVLAPDIDFYMLLDVSGSMALPTTSAGLQKVANSNSKGCKFACHSLKDPTTGIDANGMKTDLYGVAKSYGLTLRIDDEGTAVSKLTQNATDTSSKNGANYQIAIATFRGKGGYSVIQSKTGDMAAAARTTKNLTPSLFYANGCPTLACKSSEVGYGDRDSAHSDAMDQMNGTITTPGTGVNGAAPQGVLFIITDGMRDEFRPGGRPEAQIDTTKCDAIKARGVRIAILYTEYLPQSLDGDSWSQQNVKPYLYRVEPALQACASAGLYTKVTTDQDIYTALDALFQNAVATARITG